MASNASTFSDGSPPHYGQPSSFVLEFHLYFIFISLLLCGVLLRHFFVSGYRTIVQQINMTRGIGHSSNYIKIHQKRRKRWWKTSVSRDEIQELSSNMDIVLSGDIDNERMDIEVGDLTTTGQSSQTCSNSRNIYSIPTEPSSSSPSSPDDTTSSLHLHLESAFQEYPQGISRSILAETSLSHKRQAKKESRSCKDNPSTTRRGSYSRRRPSPPYFQLQPQPRPESQSQWSNRDSITTDDSELVDSLISSFERLLAPVVNPLINWTLQTADGRRERIYEPRALKQEISYRDENINGEDLFQAMMQHEQERDGEADMEDDN